MQTEGYTAESQQDLKDYEEGLTYKRRMNYLSKWPEYERFRAGDQWPPSTDKTRNLPRPVFNIIEMVEAHKVASVMSEQIGMKFSAPETDDPMLGQAADLFTRFSETTWENIKQNELNEEMLEDAGNRGTGILHYYWDPAIKGGNKIKYSGDLCGEVIDPMNFFPGNPQQRKVQKQPYIIITSRETVENVKKEAEANKVKPEMVSMIKPDKDTKDQGYDMAQDEISDKVTVITKYWREGGTIWFRKIASGVVIKAKTNTFLTLYPIVAMPWKRRKKSIFGIGDTEGLIPNQKAINLLMAMQVLSVQLTGWPKLVYRTNAIDPNKVTNTPGEMIEDKTPFGNGDGVKYLNPGSVSNHADLLVERFIEYTRQMTGANDAATGNAPSSDLNATAIMLLQKAAGIPIESVKRRFYQAMEDVGRVWEDFWKVKYNMTRNIRIKDDDGNDQTVPFNGEKYRDMKFDLKIDIGPSSTYSESLLMSSLDKFLDKQMIDFNTYLKYVPKNVVPFKDRLLKDMEQIQQEQMMMQQQQMQMMPPQPDPMMMAQQQAEMEAQKSNQQFQQQVALKQMDNENKLQIEAMRRRGDTSA